MRGDGHGVARVSRLLVVDGVVERPPRPPGQSRSLFIELMGGFSLAVSAIVGAVNWAAGNYWVGAFFGLWGAVIAALLVYAIG